MKEHQRIEWKEAWRDECLKWICGFTNAEGGVLVIGRDDQGKPVGVANSRKLLEDLPNKIRDVLGVMADVNLVKKSGKELIEIRVESYPTPISYRGACFFRNDADLLYHDEIHGDLFSQATRTVDLLLTKYLKAGIRYEGIQRVETFPVPDAALREAVLNALIHKDYASGATIQISVYADKLMIWKPTLRTYEMICHYFTGLAEEDELLAHLAKLQKQDASR